MTTASSELLTGAAYGLVVFVAVLALAAALRILGGRGRAGADRVVRPPAAGPPPVPGDALEAQVRITAGAAPAGSAPDMLRDFLPQDWTPLGPPSADPDGVRFPMARPDGSRVVVRMLPSDAAGDPRATQAFLRTARDLRAAGLPGVVALLAVETDPWPHVVEEELEGLAAVPDDDPPCPVVLRLLADLADAAAGAAAAGWAPLALAPWSVGRRGDGTLALRGFAPHGEHDPPVRGADLGQLLAILTGAPEPPPPLCPPLLDLSADVPAGDGGLAALAARLRERAAALPCTAEGGSR